jgi:protein ImuB
MVLCGEKPSAFWFRNVRYEVERAYGPWVMSGDWWSPTLWGMEQWDVVARGKGGEMLCCCVVKDAEWKVVSLYD